MDAFHSAGILISQMPCGVVPARNFRGRYLRSLPEASCLVMSSLTKEKQVAEENYRGSPSAEDTEAQNRIERIEQGSFWLDKHTYISVLRKCTNAKSVNDGKQVHARIVASGMEHETILGNLLVQMYGKCGSLQNAREAFNKIRFKNKFSWTMMLAACINNGKDKDALQLFQQMDLEGAEADLFIFSSVLVACSSLGALAEGKMIHARLILSGFEVDVPVQNALMTMYAKSGCIEVARDIFDKMLVRDIISWNAIILAYTQVQQDAEAFQVYLEMNLEGMEPDMTTFVSIIGACAELGALSEGKTLHARVLSAGLESDAIVQNIVISMYSKCGCVEDARRVFDKMSQRTLVSWTSMITAYAQHEQGGKALELFRLMNLEGMKPDEVTFSGILAACSTEEALTEGKAIHARIVAMGHDWNAVVGTALVDMYVKCGCISEAGRVFGSLPRKDLVSWNAMIAAYEQAEEHAQALETYHRMRLEGIRPDKATFAGVLGACSGLSAIKEIHTEVAAHGLECSILAGTALVCMYAKFARLDDATRVFEKMSVTNSACWNAMIGAFAKHGHGAKSSLELFQQMSLEYVEPDGITFTSILHACSHAGLLADGRQFFFSISQDYGMVPIVEHFVCMVDLLGRAGLLGEAEELISRMPFQPDIVSWKTLLGACKVHNDVDRGGRVANRVVEMDPDGAAYVLLSNMYATSGK